MAFQIANVPQGVSPNKGPFLHLRTFIPSNPSICTHTHVYGPGKAGLECINAAEFAVWEGKHRDPDTEVIHLLTLKHWDDTSIHSRRGWDEGVETFRIPAVPPWIHIGEDTYYYLQCQLFSSTHENGIKNAGKLDGFEKHAPWRKGRPPLPTSTHRQRWAETQPQRVRLMLAFKGRRLYTTVLGQLGAKWEKKLGCF